MSENKIGTATRLIFSIEEIPNDSARVFKIFGFFGSNCGKSNTFELTDPETEKLKPFERKVISSYLKHKVFFKKSN